MFNEHDLITLKHLSSENEILGYIEGRVKYYLAQNPELFFNFLYRFDLPEEKILPLIKSNNLKSISELIWARQKRKMDNWK